MNKRIVSLLPSCTEIICMLGYRENLVGISHECDYPNSILSLPVLTKARLSSDGNSIEINQSVTDLLQRGLSVYDVDASLLKSLTPDIIVTQAQCEACAVNLDQVKGIVSNWTRNKTEIISLEPNNLNEVWHGFDIIANAMDAPQSYSILKTEINERFKLLKDKLNETRKKPTILCIEWIEPIMVAANWVPELVGIAGGNNVMSVSGTDSNFCSWDEIEKTNPDIIIMMPCGFEIKRTLEDLHYLQKREEWQELKAVKENKVYVVDGNQYFNRPGPRLVDSAEILAEIINPEYFERKYSENAWIAIDS